MKNLVTILVCGVVLISGVACQAPSTNKVKTDEQDISQMISKLKYNEEAIISYQGHVVKKQYNFIEHQPQKAAKKRKATPFKYAGVYPEPKLIITTETDFIQSRSGKEKFFAQMKRFTESRTIKNPIMTERCNGDYTEILWQSEKSEPNYASIKLPNGSWYLDNSPINLDACAHAFVLASNYKTGFSRLRPSEGMRDGYMKAMGEEIVEGYKCKKYAILLDDGTGYYIAFLWFGTDIDYSIVKQKCINLNKEMYVPFSEWEKSEHFKQDMDFLETTNPISLYVNSNYIKVKNIWVPQKTMTYILWQVEKDEIGGDREKLLEPLRKNPHTSKIKGCILDAYIMWELDMDSLKLNEPINDAIFETSIIPKGIDVYNSITGVYPEKAK